MDKYMDIHQRVEAAAEEARKNKGIKTDEEIKSDFFAVAADLFNEHLAGDITLADGRTVTVPKI